MGSVEVVLVLVELVDVSLVEVGALDVVASVELAVVESAALVVAAVVSAAAVVSVAPTPATALPLEPAFEARLTGADMVGGFDMFVAIVEFKIAGRTGCRETDRIGS